MTEPQQEPRMVKQPELYVQHKYHYGNHYYDPLNKTAKEMAKFCEMRREGFNLAQMDILRAMGFKITIRPIDDGFSDERPTKEL